MSNSIRIKRRDSTGSAGAPSSLKNGELAYNEADNILYYGYGVSGSNAASIKAIGGTGAYVTEAEYSSRIANYVDLTSTQNVAGVKTLTDLLKPNAGINVNSSKFTVAPSTGNTVIAGTLNTHTIPSGSAGTFALTTDTLATHSGHSYIDIVEQDIVAGDVALGSHTSGNYVQSLAEYSTNPGISLAGDTPAEGNTITLSVDSTVIRTTGNQNLGGVKTFTSLINANAGIAVDTDKFTVADTTGNTAIGGTLAVTGVTTLTGALNANGGIAVDTNKFTVADGTGNIYTAGTLGVAGTTDLVGQTNVGDLQIDGDLSFSGTTITIDALPAASSVQTKFLVLNGTALETRTAALTRTDIGAHNATNLTAGEVNTDRLPVATSTAKGAIELFSNTAQSEAANTVSTTASRTYGIQLNSAGQAVVNVPWTDDDTIYTHHTQSAISVSEDAVGADVLDGIGITVNTEGHVTAASATKRTLTAANLGLGTTDDVEFDDLTVGNITTSGYLRGPSTFTIDPATHDDDTGKVIIAGDLQVDGTTTTINSTIVEIDDLATKVAAETTTSSTLTGAGVLIGTDPNSPPALSSGALVEFIYAHTGTRMELSSAMKITGGLEDTVIDGGTF
jgi:hypothetical protein